MVIYRVLVSGSAIQVANGAVILKNNLAVPQKIQYRVTFWPSNFTPRNFPKRIQNICPHENLYTNIYKSIISNRK